LPARSAFSDEDILNHAQKSLDRSIGILNTVATLMGVLVALLTLIIVIGGALGFLEYRRWQEFKQQAKESAEETKRYADEAKKAAEEAKPIVDRLKKAEEDITISREQSKQLPTPPEELSEDQKKILDKYGTTTELLESFGKRLEPADYYFRGLQHYFRNEFQSAIEAFEKAIELQPDYAAPWDSMGVTFGKIGDYDKSLEAFNKAIELEPDYAAAWYNKACVYSLKGDKEKALKHLSKAIDLDAKYKEEAKRDEDFKNLWDDGDFKRIVS